MRTIIKEVFPVLLGILIPLVAFTTGLRAPRSERGRLRLWRRPEQLARDLLAILVLVPLWAIFLVSIIPVSPIVRGGLLIAVLAVGIGPAAGMKRMSPTEADAREALDLNLIVLVLSMVFVPIAFVATAALFHRDLHVSVAAVAKVVLGRALLPLVLGLGAARLSPRAAAAAGPVLAKLATIVLVLVVVLAIVASWKLLAAVGVGWLVAIAVAWGAVIIGHVLGGPDPASRSVVAAASSMRFPALALVLAHVMPQGQRLIPVVLAYVIVAGLSMTLYGAVMKGRRKRERHVAPISALPQRA